MNYDEIQIENGNYAQLHNLIIEALAYARLSGAEFRCVMFLIRKTYGWHKKEDAISLSQWGEGTRTKRPHVLSALNSLVEKNIIYRRLDEGQQIPVYGINKYTDTWKNIEVDSERGKRFAQKELLPKQVTVTKTGNSTVTNTGNKSVTKTGTHNIYKDTKNTLPKKDSGVSRQMFGLLVRTCQVDGKLKRGQLNSTVKKLVDAGYTPADIEYFGQWWKVNDWRGQRGDPPTLGQVVDKILQSKQAAPKPAPEPYTGAVELPAYLTIGVDHES